MNLFPILLSAINLKQVVVEFNSSSLLDKEEAANVDNYTLEDVDEKEIKIVEAEVIKNTVTLSIAKEEEIDNQSEATLTISNKILDKEEKFDVEFFDITPPTVIGAEVVGSGTVKVRFSEPVKDLTKANVEINNGDYFIKKVEMYNNNTEANIITYSDFDEDTIKVSVKNSVEDYAGFNLISKTLTVAVVDDNDAPEIIGYENATTDSVTLIFNEDIIIDDEDETNFYHTNSKNPAVAYEKVAGNKIKVIFADTDDETTGENVPLPEGYAYVYVKGDTIVDLWGNVAENNLSIRIVVTADTEKPAVKKVEATQTEIKVTFTENVYDGADDEDNYTIFDSEGDEVKNAVTDAKVTNDVVTLTVKKLSYGTYTLAIQDVEDKSGNKIAKTTKEFKVDDTDAPDFPASEKDVVLYNLSVAGKSYKEYKIVINYAEAMAVSGKYSVLDSDNYSLVIDGENYVLDKLGNDFANVDVSIRATDKNKVVEITIKAKDLTLDADDSIVIARVADAAGNYTTAFKSDPIGFVDGESRYVTFEAEATATDTIKVKFSDALVDFEASDLIVVATDDITKVTYDAREETVANGTLLPVAKVNVTADDEVVLTLDSGYKLDYDANKAGKEVYVLAVGQKSQNRYDETFANRDGETLPEEAYAEVTDEIAPTVDKDNVVATGKVIEIPFKEAIKSASISIATFEVDGNTVTNAELKEGSENIIVLTVEKEVKVGDEITQVAPIYGKDDNKVTGLSFKVKRVTE